MLVVAVPVVWAFFGPPPDRTQKQSLAERKPVKRLAISLTHEGKQLPVEVCIPISDLTGSVERAIDLLREEEARRAVQGALSEFDEKLEEFADYPNINKVKATAAEFAQASVRFEALKRRTGLGSDDLRAGERKIRECLAEFKAA